MTTLSTLRQLAQAATPTQGSTHVPFDSESDPCPRCGLADACSPDVILAMIRVIEAADAVRLGNDCPMCDSGKLRNPNKEHWDTCAYAAYDAARAALDAGKEE